ncbi:MAG: hypothetical protein EOP72_04375 [Variovorax sp.]|jgi:hypothetical protein|nr:MAG: hypothetical protein EOP72_04375 [Variovorax sp.]
MPNDLDQKTSRRESNRPFRWMIVFLIALVVCAVGWIAFSRASPDSLVDPPTAAKPPLPMPR